MFRVRKETLLAIAGVFWVLAGANVVAVGVQAYFETAAQPLGLALLVVGTILVFAVFLVRIFSPYAQKHADRIDDMPDDRASVLEFMDAKGYIMIVFMIALGAGLRLSGFVPSWFIAFFYVGLGAALAVTGVMFLASWRQRLRNATSR